MPAGAIKTLVCLALALFGFSNPASAHSELRASRPAHGQRLDAAPPRLELHFSEKVQVTAVRLFDAVGKERPIVRDRSLVERSVYEAAAPELEAGAYRIEWRAISADGHPVGGTIRFRIGAGP